MEAEGRCVRFSLLASDDVSGWKLAVHQPDDDPAPSKSLSTELCSSSSVRKKKKKQHSSVSHRSSAQNWNAHLAPGAPSSVIQRPVGV